MSRSFDYKLIADMSASNATIGTATISSGTVTNLVGTNISAGSMSLSSAIASSSLTTSNLVATTSSAGTAVATAFTGGSVSVSGAVAAASVAATTVAATSGTIGAFAATTSSAGTAVATAFTGGAISVSGAVAAASVAATSGTIGAFAATTSSAGTAVATVFTGGSLSLSGNINIAGTLTTVNITTTNLSQTNVSAGSITATTVSAGTAVATAFTGGAISVSGAVAAASGTIGSLNAQSSTVIITPGSAGDRALYINTSNATGGTWLEVSRNNNASRAMFGIDGTGLANIESGAMLIDAWTPSTPMVFAHGSTERMRISTAGKLLVNQEIIGVQLTSNGGGYGVVNLFGTSGSYIDFGPDTIDFRSRIFHDEANRSLQILFNEGLNSGFMTFASTGNVGIGIAAPNANHKLSVNGSISVNEWNQHIGFSVHDAFTFQNQTVPNYGLSWSVTNGAPAAVAQISGWGGINFFTQTTPRVTIDGSGNVGIGTTSPNAKLHVDTGSVQLGSTAGDSTILQRWRQLTANGSSIDLAWVRTANGSNWDTAGQRFQALSDTTYQGWMQFNNGGDGGIAFGSGGAYTRTDVPERMRITSSGLVGIGTISPTSQLHVNGSIDITAYQNEIGYVLSSDRKAINTTNTIGTYSLGWRTNINGAEASAVLSGWGGVVLCAAGVPQFSLNHSGLVGIGTTSPTEKLHVAGNILCNSIISREASYFEPIGTGVTGGIYLSSGIYGTASVDNCAQVYFAVKGGGGGNIFSTLQYGYKGTVDYGFDFNHVGTSLMRILNNGRIGVGTVSPSYQFELSTDSAAKPSTTTWTTTSDERAKTNITMANLDTCYNNVKNLPLKRYTWRDEIYTPEQVPDRSKLGWIAQDVETVIPKAVTQTEQHGYSDFRSLNADQIIASLYGCVQKLIEKVESLESEIAQLKQ